MIAFRGLLLISNNALPLLFAGKSLRTLGLRFAPGFQNLSDCSFEMAIEAPQ